MKTFNLFISDLSLVCGKDQFRPAFDYVFFRKGNAYATNGHILIRQSLAGLLELEPEVCQLLEGKAIYKAQVKDLLKGVEFEFEAESVRCTLKNGGVISAPLHDERRTGKAPNFEAVIPQNLQEIAEIGLNYKLLADLSKAMVLREPDNCVHLRFHGPAMGVLVKSMGIPTEHQLGLIMPVMLNDSKF
jgi:hypothetical protein